MLLKYKKKNSSFKGKQIWFYTFVKFNTIHNKKNISIFLPFTFDVWYMTSQKLEVNKVNILNWTTVNNLDNIFDGIKFNSFFTAVLKILKTLWGI